jgi:hypothetical protein
VQGLCSLCRARRRAPWVALLWAVKIVNFPHMPLGRAWGRPAHHGQAARTRPESEPAEAESERERARKNASFWSRQIMQAKVRSFYHAEC